MQAFSNRIFLNSCPGHFSTRAWQLPFVPTSTAHLGFLISVRSAFVVASPRRQDWFGTGQALTARSAESLMYMLEWSNWQQNRRGNLIESGGFPAC